MNLIFSKLSQFCLLKIQILSISFLSFVLSTRLLCQTNVYPIKIFLQDLLVTFSFDEAYEVISAKMFNNKWSIKIFWQQIPIKTTLSSCDYSLS